VSIGLAVSRTARRTPDAIAVFDSRGDLTYAELDQWSNRFGNFAISALGLVRGDRVALYMPNRLEIVEILAGCAKAGLVYVGLNFRLEDRELRAILDNALPRLMVTTAEFIDRLGLLAEEYGFVLLDVDSIDENNYSAMLASASSDPIPNRYECAPSDNFCIVYSSGTTGMPKGILFDHAAALQHGTIAALEYEIGADSRYLIQIPHNASVNISLVPCLLVGAAIGFAESRGFSPVTFADSVHDRAVTHSFVVPTMLFRILEQITSDDSRLSSLLTLGYGSSSIPPDRVRDLVGRFGPIFIQLYGMAEIASIGTLLRKGDHQRAIAGDERLFASAGQPSYGVDVRVVDSQGMDVPGGTSGEVIFGGAHLMQGYYHDVVRTDETIVNGWLHSGDIGRLDQDGYLYIVGRTKDLIIRGGFNIAPREIEEILDSHPGVLEAAVVGLSDPEWGESVCAAVSLRQGMSVIGEELVEWCRRSGLSSIKIPERIVFFEDLPKNQVGKVAKNEIKTMLTAESA
jgi:fatty-acyl-CoA synthase